MWISAVQDWLEGVDQNKIRQKLGISEVQWREVSRKLHTLSKNLSQEDSQASGEPEVEAGEN